MSDTERQNTALRSIVAQLEKTMQCNCDLDNWQPELDSGHSWVCRIHKAAKACGDAKHNQEQEP